MRIKSVTLTNYRLYKGENKILFDNDSEKNIFLVSGENGFGKTTFLHGLLWCLYGRLMVEIDDTIKKDINNRGGYASMLVTNLNNQVRQCLESLDMNIFYKIKKAGYAIESEYVRTMANYSVSIDFTDVFIPSVPCQSLIVTRSYDIITEKESVEIIIDGSVNELTLEIGNDVFINDFILNKDIARFFFFDSERIVELAETNSMEEKRRLCSAYNEVLGVKKYEDLKKNLENVRLRFRRKSDDIVNRDKLNALIERKEFLELKISSFDSEMQQLESECSSLKFNNDELQVQMLREGNGTTLEEIKRLESVILTTKQKDEEYKTKLKSFLEYAPFAISGKLFAQTKQQLEKDFKLSESVLNIKNQNTLISNIATDLTSAFASIKMEEGVSDRLKFKLEDVLSKYKGGIELVDSPLIDISADVLREFMSVYSNVTSTYKIEFEHLADSYKKNKQTLDRTSRKMSNIQSKESDALIQNIRRKKNEVEEKISDIETQIRLLHEKKGEINRDLNNIKKQISELSKRVCLDDNDTKKDILAEELISELDTFLNSLKEEKKYSLENRIRTTMNLLMHKNDFVGRVEVVLLNDGIDIRLYSKDDSLIRKESLSKGEQQLYATSLLKALVDESGIQFPVFIDSPLQKFDKSHSSKIISEFYPSISKQVVLFPLIHKELSREEFEIMKPLVNAVYLIRNDNNHSFFERTDVNKLMI